MGPARVAATARSRTGAALVVAWCLTLLAVGVAPSVAQDDGTAAPGPAVTRIAGDDRVATAIAVAQRGFDTAPVAVLAAADATADALVGGPLARVDGGPLLLTPADRLDDRVATELDRLAVDRVVLLGGESALTPAVADQLAQEGLDVQRIAGPSRTETAVAVADAMPGWDGAVIAAADAPADAVVGGTLAAAQGRPVLLVGRDRVGEATAQLLDARAPAEVLVVGGSVAVSEAVVDALAAEGRAVTRLAGPDRFATAAAVHDAAIAAGAADPSTTWLAAGDDGGITDALAAGPVIAGEGSALLLVDGDDLRDAEPTARALRADGDAVDEIVLLGGTAAISADAPAQVQLVLTGPVLPGGGWSLLPQQRLIALYGSHFSPALGVLGEQPPSQVGSRLDAITQPYAELSARPVLPAFDLIATIATAAAGADGQYRTRSTDAEIQQWLDAARAEGAYLVLDLQPGRSDFLTEAQAYERFIREPDVGLALDPEWRTEAPETPGGGTVGSVTAAEVNAVSAWLADLVDQEGLPEKLLVIHNFRVDMITDRADLVARDGLATVLHMDGQGGRAVKLDSYRILAQQPPFANGFKVFFDEDPNPFQPAEVLALDPVPDFISYQ
ncbi:MAG: cell wall-binding repeat-containing protein [Euzebya sp.]